MADEPHLNLSDDMIHELAQRLAAHLREELGDRLIPLQKAYDGARDLERQPQKITDDTTPSKPALNADSIEG